MKPSGHLADCLHLHACYHFAPMLERAAVKGECVAEWEQELEALSAAGRAQVVCLCLYTSIYMYMCVCVCVCMHACIYVCTHMALSAAGRAQVVCLCLCVAYLSCVYVLWPPGASTDTD